MLNNLINGYPMTNFHEINLDYVISLVRQNAGLHLVPSGNQILLQTLDGTTVSAIVAPYAENAGHADTATSANTATFATSASNATNATNATNAGHALTADSATTAGTAQTAVSATTAGTATEAVHAQTADTALSANTATTASNATYAETTGSVEHAEKAIETVALNGNYFSFTTHDGTVTELASPYAVKASRDSSANVIIQTYVANVVDNNGTLEFKNAQGNTIVSITPTSATAQNDTYNNLIADYIKTVTVDDNSNYLTVTHGTGDTDPILIRYSERAYKDTNDNVIKNTYIKSLAMVEDDHTGHYNLVAYNGDNPTAEVFRLELIAYRAQIADEATHATNADYATNAGYATTAGTADIAISTPNGESIESYTKSLVTNDSNYGDQYIVTKDGNGNVLTAVNLFTKSRIVLGFKDLDQTNPVDPYTLAVGASGNYIVEDLADYGFSTIWDMLNPAIFTGYINTSNVMIQWCPIYYSNGYYMISCFDYQGNAFKTFRITKGTNDNEILLERFL